MQQSNYPTRGALDDPMVLLHEAEDQGQQCIGSSKALHKGYDSFDCCTERYDFTVLLPNSELTKGNNKGNNKRDADAPTVRL